MDDVLKKGTLNCPKCKERLHFQVLGSMRLSQNGLFDSYCPKCKKYYKVKAEGK